MPINIPKSDKKRIVIVGAGFAGLRLARKLMDADYQVVLIDQNNYHQFQPLFYQVATAGLEPSAISFPLRKIFQKKENLFIRVTNVSEIDAAQKQIITDEGALEYDDLVIATGVKTSFFGMENVRQHAIPMKTVAQALALRNELLSNYEKAVTIDKRNEDELTELLKVVIVGGGPTGVEVAGALADQKNFVLQKDYPDLDLKKMGVILIEANNRLLNGMSDNAGSKALSYLQKLGVEIRLSTIVTNYDGETVELKSGDNIKTKTLIWAAGIRGNNPKGIDPQIIRRGNRLAVNRQNKMEGQSNIYALGDISFMVTPRYQEGHPQVAQVAIQQADNLAKNFKRMDHGLEPIEFEYNDRGSMATVGRNLAVVDLPHLKFGGRFAWFVWMFVHLMAIVGVKNRLLIFINWLWNYITFDQSLRLLIKPYRRDSLPPLQ